MTYEDWAQLYLRRGSSAFLTYTTAQEQRPSTFFAYVLPLSVLTDTPKQCTLVILIDDVKFKQNIDMIRSVHGSEFSILNSNGAVYTTNPQFSEGQTSSAFSNVSGLVECGEGEWKSMGYYTSSNIANWKYISYIPKEVYNKKFHAVRNLWLLYLCISLPAGILLAFWLLRKNYQPIGQLISTLRSQTISDSFDVQDEFEYIHHIVQKTIADHDIVSKELKQQSALTKEYYMMKLLYGGNKETAAFLLQACWDANQLSLLCNYYYKTGRLH